MKTDTDFERGRAMSGSRSEMLVLKTIKRRDRRDRSAERPQQTVQSQTYTIFFNGRRWK
ncbi:hypothetical protein [Rhizobiales bacterium]|uniref:hypothetical protein n=1 Tax=Rhizobium leguminosarum TaxID=384 RepID=UPI0013B02212